MTLRYTESAPIVVQGSVTGRQYSFSGRAPTLAVEARDADILLRTRFFRRA